MNIKGDRFGLRLVVFRVLARVVGTMMVGIATVALVSILKQWGQLEHESAGTSMRIFVTAMFGCGAAAGGAAMFGGLGRLAALYEVRKDEARSPEAAARLQVWTWIRRLIPVCAVIALIGAALELSPTTLVVYAIVVVTMGALEIVDWRLRQAA